MPTQIKIDLTDVREKLGLLATGMRRAGILAAAEWLRFTIRQSFEQQRSPEGVPWKQLSPNYAATKGAKTGRVFARRVGKGGRPGRAGFLNRRSILYLSGELFRSVDRGMTVDGREVPIGTEPDAGRVSVTTTLPYAAAHQFGSTHTIPEMRPKKKNGVLRWYGGAGDAIFARRTKAHSVTIPARPFLPTPEFAEREAARVIEEAVQQVIEKIGAE